MKSLKTRGRTVALVVLLVALCLPANAQLYQGVYQFYPSWGYYNGGTLYYLMTDVGQFNWAETLRLAGFNVNFTPRLQNALNPALRDFWDPYTLKMINYEFMPTLYFVSNNPQPLVFSAQWPVTLPAGNPVPPPIPPNPHVVIQPKQYMPIWRLQVVTWNNPANAVLLKSEADIVNRIDPNPLAPNPTKLRVTDVNVAVGASILINSLGQKIPQATVISYVGRKLVRLPIKAVFVDGLVYKTVRLDFNVKTNASAGKGNFAPWLSRFNVLRQIAPPANTVSQKLFSFWPLPPQAQLFIEQDAPTPFGTGNTNAAYSPLVNEWKVTTRGQPYPLAIYTSELAIAALPQSATDYLVYAPIVGM